jgi:histone-lysine N-methyltransferase SETMAR
MFVNSEKYSYVLLRQLKAAVRRKRSCLSSPGVCLQHHNSLPHTVKQIQGLQFEVLPHPPYSPDLAPSDFHLSWSLEDCT